MKGLLSCLAVVALLPRADAADAGVLNQPWYELNAQNFVAYSSASTQAVAQIVGKLEQFRQAYSMLAGQTTISTPIRVMAFADQAALRPYLGEYEGKPENAGGFFVSGLEGNLIAVSLSQSDSYTLRKIYHEYAHYLFRGNSRLWPLWLNEGMAEMYSTFSVAGSRVSLGQPIPGYIRYLQEQRMLPLERLLQVDRKSPEYNEDEHQGVFYAQSWLLTHYLMLAHKSALRPRLANYLKALQAGQTGLAAFTNSFGVSLPVMEQQLKSYLKDEEFGRLDFQLPEGLSKPAQFRLRPVFKVEALCRLGDQLRRIGRAASAESLYRQALQLAPGSHVPLEGLGLAAAASENDARAQEHLSKAVSLGSTNHVVLYMLALTRMEKHRTSSDGYVRLPEASAREVREPLQKAIRIMPAFGPAQHLLGFLELVQAEDLGLAEKHLQAARRLEPDNENYLLALAQAQLAKGEKAKAVSSLQLLMHPNTEPELRRKAEQVLARLKPPTR